MGFVLLHKRTFQKWAGNAKRGQDEHLPPGTEIPGGNCPELEDKRTFKEKAKDAWENFKDFVEEIMEEMASHKPIMPLPWPLPGPVPVPIP